MNDRIGSPNFLLLLATLLVTALFLEAPANAGCDVSPPPPAPQTCDPGGEASESEILNCKLAGLSYGSFVSVGRGGTSSATSRARRTVFEGQSSSSISNCDVYNPEEAEQLLFNADARAIVAGDAFEVGVHVTDYRPGRGDQYSGTLEASNAQVANSIAALQGMSPNQDLDVVIGLSGSFSGSSGRAGVQLAVRDFSGETLGAMFVANKPSPIGTIQWRVLECPDPRNDPECDLGVWVDIHSAWPGSYDLKLKLPATAGNGLWVELKTEVPLDADAPTDALLTASFQNSAVVDIRPPVGATVTMASGQVFRGPALPPRPFEVSAVAEDQLGYAGESLEGTGDSPLTVEGSTGVTDVEARGIAGSGRLRAQTVGGEICQSGGGARLGWEDIITASGAESYRMEFEFVGAAEMPATEAVPQGYVRSSYGVGVSAVGRARTFLRGEYSISSSGGMPSECQPGQQIEVGDACFSFGGEQTQIPYDVTGTGDLGEGPVVVGFDVSLPEGEPVEFEFSAAATTDILIGGLGGPTECDVFATEIDLGSPGRYVRFLGITEATTGGELDETYEVESARGYDYGQPAPLIEALPEPGAMLSAVAGLVTLGMLRRRNDRRG